MPYARNNGWRQTRLSMHTTLPPWRRSVTARPLISYRHHVSGYCTRRQTQTHDGSCVVMTCNCRSRQSQQQTGGGVDLETVPTQADAFGVQRMALRELTHCMVSASL